MTGICDLELFSIKGILHCIDVISHLICILQFIMMQLVYLMQFYRLKYEESFMHKGTAREICSALPNQGVGSAWPCGPC